MLIDDRKLGPPADIDLGIYRHRGDALEPWDPRPSGHIIRRPTPRERRRLAHVGTRGRRGARRVPAHEKIQAPLPEVVREMVNPHDRIDARERALSEEGETLARTVGILGAFDARAGLAQAQAAEALGTPADPYEMERHVAVLAMDHRLTEIAKERARLQGERVALSPLRRGFVAHAPEYRVLRRVEYGAEIRTDIRCACSPRCAIGGWHIVRLRALIYTDDPDAVQPLADALAHPHISRLTSSVR